MQSKLSETTAVPTTGLIYFALFHAQENGEWNVPTPEDLYRVDALHDGVCERNVDRVEADGDGVVLHGSFDVEIVTGRSRGSYYHPPEVTTATTDVFFWVACDWDGLNATVEVEF